jgi:predicted nucleic acid-binding protein
LVIVDSTVWIDYLAARANPETRWLKSQPRGSVGLTDLVLCEVLRGIRLQGEFDLVRGELEVFPVFSSGGFKLAVQTAENYRFLRARGITVRKTIDCLIATVCIENGYALLHNDRDFDPFETHLGLRVIHP